MFGVSVLLLTALLASTEIEISQQAIPSSVETTSQETSLVAIEQTVDTTPSIDLVITNEEKPKLITITNAIEPTMLAYKHWTGTYSPEIFTISINDTQIAAGETYTLDSSNDIPLIVQFDYSFMNGIRKGSKKISYQINKECTHASLTFSWLDTWKVIIDNATPLKEETI